MSSQILRKIGTAIVSLLALALCLFSDSVLARFNNPVGLLLREALAIVCSSETQWIVLSCGLAYFAVFTLIRSRQSDRYFWRLANSSLWLIGMLIVATFAYAFHYLATAKSTQALTLLAGAALGQGVMVWHDFKGRKLKIENVNSSVISVVSFLVVLALASVWQTDAVYNFEYHSHTRWFGPWDNPNIFGLLMSVGVLLALGLASGISHLASGKYAAVILFLVATGFIGRGLLHSYSRGAWLATGCGMIYLIAKSEVRSQKPARFSSSSFISWFKKNWLALSIILISTFMLLFLHFRQTDWHLASRALSAARAEDFSWRNRVAAWEGALQITAEHSWFGAGWNQPEPLYEQYYLPPRLSEGAAIEMNDYLMLGATLGIPALFCFGMYLWLSLTGKAESRNRKAEMSELDWLQTTCRAGAIVLLIGFWFDGGLFKLPTAATFWILLELGTVQLHKKSSKAEQ